MSELLALSEIYGKLRKAIDADGGQSAFAERHSISTGYVSDVLNARRDPGEKILSVLGYVRVVRYIPTTRDIAHGA